MPHIPGFRLQRRLGAGARAVVYQAIQDQTERVVALKVLDPTEPLDVGPTQDGIHERAITTALRHRNLARIYAQGEYDGRQWLASEYLAGGSLAECIGRGLSTTRTLAVLVDLTRGLGHAHQHGIVHGDVKPANVLFRGRRCQGDAVLVDFGSARQMQDGELQAGGGTPAYMSPEQARGEALDARADLYSLGILLREMLTGHVPADTRDLKVSSLPVSVRWLQPLLDTLLAPEPGDRPDSAEALLDLLANLLQAAPEAARLEDPAGWIERFLCPHVATATSWTQSRWFWLLVVSGVGLLVLMWWVLG